MASYFHGNSEIQTGNDGLQTLILMNPSYIGFSETQHHHAPPPPGGSSSNIVFFNSNPPGNSINLSHAPPPLSPPPPPSSQQFVGIPLTTTAFTAPSQDTGNNNNNNNNESISALHGFLARSSQYGFYNTSNDITAARDITRAHHNQQQGLSLSLSSQQPGFGNFMAAREIVSSPTASASASGVLQQQQQSITSVPLSSKYMKAAQELLDEVVNVGKSMKTTNSTEVVNNDVKKSKKIATMEVQLDGGEGDSAAGAELSTAERQEIQMKKAKLVNMLDEVIT